MAYFIFLIVSYILFITGVILEVKNYKKSKRSCIFQGAAVAFWFGGAIAKGQIFFAAIYAIFLIMNAFDFLKIKTHEDEKYQNEESEYPENPNEIFKNSPTIIIRYSSYEEEYDNFFEFTIPTNYFIETMEITEDEIIETIRKMTGDDAMWLYDKSVEDKVIIDKTIHTIYKN